MTENKLINTCATSISQSPNVGIAENDREHRGFHFFRYQVAEELSITLDSGSRWTRLILQASHVDRVIRHAAIAVGSMGERLLINDVLTSDNAKANSRHEFARTQYHKAITLLREQLRSGHCISVESTLLSCFLFCCFNFLQGKRH